MSKSISQTPATVAIYCGNQVLSAPRGGFAAGAGASEMRPYQDGAYPPAEGSPKGRLRGVRICRGEAGASEMRPYQSCAADVARRRLSEPTRCRRAQTLRRKTRLMEGEARDEGASAELSDMQRRGSSDAR